MKLKNIIIENFRCFKQFSLIFAPHITVLIGKNGAGKTSLLNAIRYGISVFFSNDKSMGDDLLIAGNPDLKVITSLYTDFYRGKDDDMSSLDLDIEMKATFNEKEITWNYYKKSTSGASLYPSKYQQAYRTFMQEYRQSDQLPLFVFYSDSFPHVETRISDFAKNAIKDQDFIIRNFAYYKWNSEVSCTQIWQRRLINSLLKQLSLKEKDLLTAKEIEYIRDKMTLFSKPMNDMYVDNYSFEIDDFYPIIDEDITNLYVHLKDGRNILFENLPAGYKRLYSIAFDLSYRLFILQMKNEKEPSGIAIIDEIDLHLHPTLEQEALLRFQRTFPTIQFIVSTHSPMVISNLKVANEDNLIYKMEVEQVHAKELPDVYGIDYTTTVYEFMDTPYPENEVQEEIDAIIRLTRRKKYAMAEKRKEELKEMVTAQHYEKILIEINEILSKY